MNPDLFTNPPAKYRGAPFWAWNCKLEADELTRQIHIFKEMGLGGFFMHSRSGLATEYMGEAFMQLVATCNRLAIDNDMFCFLYDEDRWPSGAAGGLVTKDHTLRSQLLVFCPAEDNFGAGGPLPYRRNQVDTTVSRRLLARYKVQLRNGDLVGYERVDAFPDDWEKDIANDNANDAVWYYEAYLAVAGDDPWYNNEAYVNTLDKKAIARFIELTHEKYKATLGDHFGKSVPAIFTDEPQFSFKQTLERGAVKQAVTLPFTDDFEDTYTLTYGEGLLDFLPELFWEWQDGRYSTARYRYHDHVCERFTQAFADQIGNWCASNGIVLTGHMMEEATLTSQTRAIGDCMRAYRGFGLPGIDMLCDRREYATAKQAQSTAHQFGRAGVLSELYGVTNWDFDFRGHKLQGDWQAALGVTLRVHHLTWVSMAGEAKRDYPASIGYQSPWYKEYPLIEDHFARVNTALTRGKPIVRVAVIHPVESLWAAFGPNDKTAAQRDELEKQFSDVIDWLLFGQMDFDFVSESLLPQLHHAFTNGGFTIGAMTYDAVVVPGNLTLRATTVEALTQFANDGGNVVYMGTLPALAESGAPANITSPPIPFAKTALLQALAPHREVEITRTDGTAASRWIYQLRQDDDCRWLFVCNGTRPANQDLPDAEEVVIHISGIWHAELYDTMTGAITPLATEHKNEGTYHTRTLHMHDSLLLRLSPIPSHTNTTLLHAPHSIPFTPSFGHGAEGTDLLPPYAYTLSEPNVLLLDRAAYAFDDGEWQATTHGEDILRIDNAFRDQLGYPLRRNKKAQPWTLGTQPAPSHMLSLRFTIQSEIALEQVHLAFENAASTQIIWQGEIISATPNGYYTDKSIQTVPLPGLRIGENILILRIPFDRATDVENCFLLGQFGVMVRGAYAVVTTMPASLPFGDITHMGFPFYGGNITYHCRVPGGGRVRLAATHFTNPLLAVDMGERRAGTIAFAPYEVDLGILAAGQHDVDITAFGNRVNTFGAIHNANANETWFGPDAWRTTGAAWSNEYRLKPTGILVAPRYITVAT